MEYVHLTILYTICTLLRHHGDQTCRAQDGHAQTLTSRSHTYTVHLTTLTSNWRQTLVTYHVTLSGLVALENFYPSSSLPGQKE